MSEPVLRVSGAEKSFGASRALDGVSLEAARGAIVGLLGPNGAGKTTLVRAIAGRVALDGGSIEIGGSEAPAGDWRSRSRLGWVPQELALYGSFRVEENLRVFGRYHGIGGGELDDAVDRSLEWSGLSERRSALTEELSGGMKRRLNMAAGVIHDPELVLMDEPTVGVDVQSREKIYEMIEQMRAAGAAIIYTTHYMEEAERLCDTIAIIDRGRVIAAGTRDELVTSAFGKRREARATFDCDLPPAIAAWVRGRNGAVEGRRVSFPVDDPHGDLAAILELAESEGCPIDDLTLATPSLGELFLRLTGTELRE
jgi:ABC-2 type transport system ATP-binding protein